jgi:putative methyltransferase (TIGR04325 family)
LVQEKERVMSSGFIRRYRKKWKRLFRREKPEQGIAFAGDYHSWDDAARHSKGYDSGVILERTRAALLKVKNGEAVYERDSVVFDKIQHSFPLLAGLQRAALKQEGRISVVDFGGALGSSYFQCRDFLQGVRQLEWLVIDQTAQVECGRKDFEGDELHFYHTIEECLAGHRPNVLLFSSVLQYLPSPHELLEKYLGLRIPWLIIDRTPFLRGERDRLTVQQVPEYIYPASYPAWLLNEARLVASIQSAGYRLLADFPSLDRIPLEGERVDFKGFIFERADAAAHL